MSAIETALILAKREAEITSQIIKDLVGEHSVQAIRMKALYERYKATTAGVPIFSREFDDTSKINNQLNNDFFSEIVDAKIGYLFGVPVSYMLDKEINNYAKIEAEVDAFHARNTIEDLDAETGKKAAICGYGARLLYVDAEGKERVMNVDPWEVIPVYDRSIVELQIGVRYYTVMVTDDQGKSLPRTRVEWYDDQTITFYIENENADFVLDDTEETNPRPHLFDMVPLVIFANNEETLGDAERVLSLIDGYDRTISDLNSEFEQFRLSYMIFKGFEVDAATVEAAKKTGGFEIGQDDDMSFLTKDIEAEFIEKHLDRLEANIMRFAKSVNFTDEQFAGNQSGVALRFKLLSLESKSVMTERKFTAAFRQMFKILSTAWAKKSIDLDYLKITFRFTRNLPVNIVEEAESTGKLKGFVSEETRLSLLSFVEDVEGEQEKMKADNEGLVDLDALKDPDNGTE